MKIETFLNILKNIEILLKSGDLSETREYIRLEIKNLKNITEKECLNNSYCYDWYCKECSNLNCNNNCYSKIKK